MDTESNIVVIDQNNVRTYYALTASAATSVEEKSKEEHQIRKPHDLLSNHPNPFILKTVIRYRISAISEGTNDDQKARQVSLQIYDILGQKVRSLVNGSQKPGIYEVVWRGKDDIGKFLPNGIYFYRLQVDSFSKVRKMIFMR